jgi:aminoglycoside phosphotransferase (APT) family kinase protein
MESVNAGIDQPGPVRPGEELDAARVEAWLRSQLEGATGTLSVAQFASGHSNLTYLVTMGNQEWVLRRPPFGNPVKSAHDMGREFRVLSKLCQVYPPAPRPVLYCQDPDVIGAEFYLMERRTGVILRRGEPPAELALRPDRVAKLCEAFVDNLVVLHGLDYREAGLADLGRPEGYIERQVAGWTRRFHDSKTEEQPGLERLSVWLAEHRPADGPSALIHNDYKYDNLILASDNLTRIVAVLDWEMATIGDPLMDLGGALAYWVQPDDPVDDRASAFGPTLAAGSLTRREIASRYAEQAGIKRPNMLFYYCFGLFKLAVIIQQIYARYVRGLTRDPRFAGLIARLGSLGRAGLCAIETGEV